MEENKGIPIIEMGYYIGCGRCNVCEAEELYAPCINATFVKDAKEGGENE